MKVGIRKPNLKKSFKARTTGKVKRQVRKTVDPTYGKKGVGFIKDPKRSLYNKVYNRTTVSAGDIARSAVKPAKKSGNRNNRPNKWLIVFLIFACICVLAASSVIYGLLIFAGIIGILAFIFLYIKEKKVSEETDTASQKANSGVSVKCPFCGALIEAPLGAATVTCDYCDSKLVMPESPANTKSVAQPAASKAPLNSKKSGKVLIASITLLVLGVFGAITGNSNSSDEVISDRTVAEIREEESESQITPESNRDVESKTEETSDTSHEMEPKEEIEANKAEDVIDFDASMIPEFTGQPYEYVNDGVPFFGPEFSVQGMEFSDLDELGRAGAATAMLGIETMPTGERGDISSIHPTGWNNIQFEGIDGLNVFNRCHLIAWQLSGENANEKNLITGTRYFNVEGMEPFEKKTANYIKETGNHVYYRVTPVYTDSNLLADGVLMEAKSVEDDGLSFCVFCYNVQPEVNIDYATGEASSDTLNEPTPLLEIENSQESSSDAGDESTRAVVIPVNENENEVENIQEESEENEVSDEVTYIANSNTGKFHKPYCSSVDDMAEHNKVYFYGDRQEVVDAGYVPCKRCNP